MTTFTGTLNGQGGTRTAVVQADADNAGAYVLLVTGTSRNDSIVIEPNPADASQVHVKINNREVGSFASSSFQRIIGYGLNGNDTIVVNWVLAQAAVIFGGNGNDTLVGGSGNDQLSGGSGNDTFYGGAGDDALSGGSGNDSLHGQDGNDTLLGEAGNDRLDGEAGDDLLLGGAGNDFLYGGDGNDKIYGEVGNDQLLGESGNDLLLGGDGVDKLFGGDGRDLLIGGPKADTLFGNAGDDILIAGKTVYDDNPVALDAILAEWTSGNSYEVRIDNLEGNGGGSGANGSFVLIDDVTVAEGIIDTLAGNEDRDWFFTGTPNKLRDRAQNEVVA
jgi:Ca2+-binding RTX toxin-like protein